MSEEEIDLKVFKEQQELIKIWKEKYYQMKEERDKQKEVLDKIKEYITTRTPSDIGISGNRPKKYYTLNEDEVDYILELLEEIE